MIHPFYSQVSFAFNRFCVWQKKINLNYVSLFHVVNFARCLLIAQRKTLTENIQNNCFWRCTYRLSTWWNLRFRQQQSSILEGYDWASKFKTFYCMRQEGGNLGAHFLGGGSCWNGETQWSRWVQLPYWNRVFFTAVFTTTVSKIILRTETKKSTFSHIMKCKCKFKDLIYPSNSFDKQTNSLKSISQSSNTSHFIIVTIGA